MLNHGATATGLIACNPGIWPSAQHPWAEPYPEPASERGLSLHIHTGLGLWQAKLESITGTNTTTSLFILNMFKSYFNTWAPLYGEITGLKRLRTSCLWNALHLHSACLWQCSTREFITFWMSGGAHLRSPVPWEMHILVRLGCAVGPFSLVAAPGVSALKSGVCQALPSFTGPVFSFSPSESHKSAEDHYYSSALNCLLGS